MVLPDSLLLRLLLVCRSPAFLFAFVPVSCLNGLAGAIIIHGFVVCDRPAFLFDIFILFCFNVFAGCYIIHDLDLVMTCLQSAGLTSVLVLFTRICLNNCTGDLPLKWCRSRLFYFFEF